MLLCDLATMLPLSLVVPIPGARLSAILLRTVPNYKQPRTSPHPTNFIIWDLARSQNSSCVVKISFIRIQTEFFRLATSWWWCVWNSLEQIIVATLFPADFGGDWFVWIQNKALRPRAVIVSLLSPTANPCTIPILTPWSPTWSLSLHYGQLLVFIWT